MDWCRLWHDAPDDPKWRVIARKADCRVGDVWAVFTRMLVRASASNERGSIAGWDDEVEAVALDFATESVTAIRDAMQGRILQGDAIKAWSKRQPKREREDNSADRTKAYRERLKGNSDDNQNHVTPCDASVTAVTPRLDKRREDKKEEPPLTPPKQSTSAAPAPKPVDDREKADQELMAFAERVEAAAGSDGAKSPAWASASMTIAQLRQAGCSDEVIMAAARQAKAATVDKGKRPCGPAYVATIATNMRDDAKSAAATYAQPEQPGGYGGTPRTVEDNPLWAKWRTHLLRSDRMDELAEFKAFQSEHGHDAASERASQSAKAEGVRL